MGQAVIHYLKPNGRGLLCGHALRLTGVEDAEQAREAFKATGIRRAIVVQIVLIGTLSQAQTDWVEHVHQKE